MTASKINLVNFVSLKLMLTLICTILDVIIDDYFSN
jgi:hypothetical protein